MNQNTDAQNVRSEDNGQRNLRVWKMTWRYYVPVAEDNMYDSVYCRRQQLEGVLK